MTKWTEKLLSILGIKNKGIDVIVEGGFDVLPRLGGSDENGRSFMSAYGKSLYVYACISKIAEKVATMNLRMYQVVNSKGDTKELTSHLALDLMYHPNSFQTRGEFFEITMINLKLAGNAFWLKVRNKGGRVVEMMNLRPDLIAVVTNSDGTIRGYEFMNAYGGKTFFDIADIIHLKYPDPMSQYLGMSPLRPAQLEVQTLEYSARYQRDFFLNNARPDALIKNKNNTLTKEQKEDLKEGWNKQYRGLGKNSKIAVLKGDLEYQQISISQREMDYIESKKFSRDDILVAFKVPKVVLSIVEDVNRANAEAGYAVFLAETIKPEMQRLVDKLTEELLVKEYGEQFYFTFDDPTPASRTETVTNNASALEHNWKLINEVRQEENLPPVTGGWSFYLPFGVTPAGGISQTNQPKAIEISLDEEYRGVIKSKRFDFRGHSMLKWKLEMVETLVKEARAKLSKTKEVVTKEVAKETEQIKHSMIEDKEKREIYAKVMNNRIDKMAEPLKAASNAFFADQYDRVAKALKKEVKAKKKGAKTLLNNIFDKESEIALTIDFISPFLREFLEEAAKDSLASIAPQEEFQTTAQIIAKLNKRADAFGKDVTDTTIEKLNATLAEGLQAGEGISSLTTRVADVYGEFASYRSERIARTEATAANNEGIQESFKQSGVANGKEWINAGDSNVREEHQDGSGVGGEIVGLSENFSNGLPYPSEVNCRCVLGPAFIE